MGSVERTEAGRWKARYRDPQGRSRRRTFARKRDAELFLSTVDVDVTRGEWVDPIGGRMTFGAWVGEWGATTVHLREATRVRYERDLRLHLLPAFGDTPLASITPRDVRVWLSTATATGTSASAINRRFRVLRMVLNAAVANEVIARSPCKAVKPPPPPREEVRFLSAVQVWELAEATHPWFRTWVYFAAYTGLRWSEMLGLRRKDVDLLRRVVRVEQQLIEVNSRFLGFGPPKTAAGRRSVTLPTFLVPLMEEQIAERAQPGVDGLVFVNTAGRSPHASSFASQTWAKARRDGGFEGLRWHDLRHTAVALAIEQGAHAKAIQARLGHSSIAVTLDRYGHLLPSIEEGIAAGLDESFRRALETATRTAEVAPLRPRRKAQGHGEGTEGTRRARNQGF